MNQLKNNLTRPLPSAPSIQPSRPSGRESVTGHGRGRIFVYPFLSQYETKCHALRIHVSEKENQLAWGACRGEGQLRGFSRQHGYEKITATFKVLDTQMRYLLKSWFSALLNIQDYTPITLPLHKQKNLFLSFSL